MTHFIHRSLSPSSSSPIAAESTIVSTTCCWTRWSLWHDIKRMKPRAGWLWPSVFVFAGEHRWLHSGRQNRRSVSAGDRFHRRLQRLRAHGGVCLRELQEESRRLRRATFGWIVYRTVCHRNSFHVNSEKSDCLMWRNKRGENHQISDNMSLSVSQKAKKHQCWEQIQPSYKDLCEQRY